jgi:cysteine desulfurase
MARALEVSVDLMRDVERVRAMRDRLIKGLTAAIPGVRLNGDPDMRLPGNVNVSIDGVSGESVAILLDMKGIYVSTGSACATGIRDPSRVLLSLGLSREEADSSIRISLSYTNTDADVDYILEQLPPIVMRLRKLRTGNYDEQ